MLSDKYYLKEKFENITVGELKEALAEKLKEYGFGILTEIDVKKTMKEKINKDYEDFLILGLCNPNFADTILSNDKDFALFLPCNALIYKEDEKVTLSLIRPSAVLPESESGNDSEDLAQKVEEIFAKVFDSLRVRFNK